MSILQIFKKQVELCIQYLDCQRAVSSLLRSTVSGSYGKQTEMMRRDFAIPSLRGKREIFIATWAILILPFSFMEKNCD